MLEIDKNIEPEARENCALFGVVLEKPDKRIHQLVAQGIDAQQHRGEEAAGMSWVNRGSIKELKGLGLRPQATPVEDHPELPATTAEIGHTRYSTAGKSSKKEDVIKNTQPFRFASPENHHRYDFAIAHNGTIQPFDNYEEGDPTSDTYTLGKEVYKGQGNLIENIIAVAPNIKGAYRGLFISKEGRLLLLTDPHGFRPARFGKFERDGMKGGAIASETVGLSAIGANNIQRIPRGSLVEILPNGFDVIWRDPRAQEFPEAVCSFEPMYFADAASRSKNGETNHTLRVEAGQQLVRRYYPQGDYVSPIPMSGWSFSEGVSKESNLPLIQSIHVNRYRGRNFIKPSTPEQRKQDAFLKYRFIPELINGKNMIIVDDSIVRGSTTQGLILALFELGANNIELMIGIPPIISPCYWGIDFPNPMELIYNQLMAVDDGRPFESKLSHWLVGDNQELVKRLRVSFQDLDDYKSLLGDGHCFHCVNGEVPQGAVPGSNHPFS